MKTKNLSLFLLIAGIALAGCQSSDKENASEEKKSSADYFIKYDIQGPDYTGGDQLTASEIRATNTTGVNIIEGSKGNTTFKMTILTRNIGEVPYNSRTAAINVFLDNSDPVQTFMTTEGSFDITAYEEGSHVTGTYTGGGYLKRQNHSFTCSFHLPLQAYVAPVHEERKGDAPQRVPAERQRESETQQRPR
jgi:hypothetical protein